MAPMQSKPPLLTLPRVLRDIIYEYALKTDVTVEFQRTGLYNEAPLVNTPGLPLVCKQLHRESIQLYYMYSKFILRINMDIFNWLRRLPIRYRQLLRCVRLIQDAPLWYSLDPSLLGVGMHDILRNGYLARRLAAEGIILGEGVVSAWYEEIRSDYDDITRDRMN
ncbi:hypothetical protein M409DRAFT_24899 [Zasmidium cellare ATCC 36951]|uniref:Uncharacterized protein n=1 Tax=Zasmidium cellare ATCC 36951 TaxID=1080233 RepID=A0A6A6CFR6_ZASCE|nr:uncharacterized protein M409DRAFT_24899 [Zasmidium cellare ATCC 36951]KAF2164998.1 hypothetical protein M409DRAFT_24899 [Zasmidium cellare ATCC 36951]